MAGPDPPRWLTLQLLSIVCTVAILFVAVWMATRTHGIAAGGDAALDLGLDFRVDEADGYCVSNNDDQATPVSPQSRYAGNDQVLAEAPATGPRAHGIVDHRLLSEGLLWIQLGFGPDGFVKLLIIGLVDRLRYVGITNVGSAFAASPNLDRPRYVTHDERVLYPPEIAPLADFATAAKIFHPHALPTFFGHVWLISKASALSGIFESHVTCLALLTSDAHARTGIKI